MEDYDHNKVELEMLEYWKKKEIFKKLREKIKGKKHFSFIDGPITANNPMGVHHAWGRTYKDLFQRFKAMQGYDQRFQNGFDCQGLWVEVEVEKELGFNSKQDIENFGLDNFAKKCRERVEKFSKIQTDQSIRLGQWMDWGNDYFTMSDNNNQYVWLFLKKCHENGWLYKGTDVMPWCIRCGTSLSQHELYDSYKELTHTAVYFQVKIKDRDNDYLLIWSTTPWTFPGNVAAAVHPEVDYAYVSHNKKFYYLSEKTLNRLKGDYTVIDVVKGKELVGLEYESPFPYLPVQKNVKHKVVAWEAVGEEDGTGIIHIAPGCGKEDNYLGKTENLPEIAPLDEEGNYIEGYDWLTDKNVTEVGPLIIKDLEKRGMLYRTEDFTHRYPCCWRCRKELVFRLVNEWFINTDPIRQKLIDVTKKIKWHPDYTMKRQIDWFHNMGDWCISRKRYWGLTLPFFECECGHLEVIGSQKELMELAKEGLDQLEELHRPWMDNIVIECSKCGKDVKRITEVGDCWLDAGIVSFSTLDYMDNKEYWQEWFPADFICECAPGQFRGWFYSLLFMSVTLADSAPFKSILAHDLVKDELGEDMHKSKGNAIWFDDAAEKMGVDIMRWMYASQNPASPLLFGYSPAKEVERYLKIIWNLATYIQTYCKDMGKDESKLDIAGRWIVSRRESVKKAVTEYLEKLEPHHAMDVLKEYMLNDLSRGYGQLIREKLNDKTVQRVLYNSYMDGLKMLAPIMPFITDKIFIELTGNESIHLEDWPAADEKLIDAKLEEHMKLAQEIVTDILFEREKANLGIRWPLKEVTITLEEPIQELAEIIKVQANIKEIKFKKGEKKIELDTELTPELEKEGYAREITRRIQNMRKKAGLKKENEIELVIVSDYDLAEFEKEIKDKVGAKTISFKEEKKEFSNKDKFKIREKEFKVMFNLA